MGFMGTGKSAEDKALEKLATYLENMDLRPKDGMVHAGAFEMAGGYSRKNTSRRSRATRSWTCSCRPAAWETACCAVWC